MTAPHAYASAGIDDQLKCHAGCICGVTYVGFATLAEATALLDEHIATSLPAPTQGHLPAGADKCLCHPGERHWCSKRPTPTLAEHVADAERLANELITALARQYDPESVPAVTWANIRLRQSDLHLGFAVSQIRQAITHLQAVAELCASEVSA